MLTMPGDDVLIEPEVRWLVVFLGRVAGASGRLRPRRRSLRRARAVGWRGRRSLFSVQDLVVQLAAAGS